jgi:hypothetical protein
MLTAVRILNLKTDLSSFYRNTDDFISPAIQLCGDGGDGGGGDGGGAGAGVGGDTVNCTTPAFESLNFKNLYVRFGKN